MEIPDATLITVRSSTNSLEVDDDASIVINGGVSRCPFVPNRSRESGSVTPTVTVFANPSMHSPLDKFENGVERRGIIKVNTESLESHMLEEIEEMEEEDLDTSQSHKDSQDEHIIEVDSPTQLPPGRGQDSHCGHGLHSVSTSLVADEERRTESLEDEVSIALEWFRSTFNKIGKDDRITLRDFKRAATECDGFAEHLFKLFDTDNSYSVSLQELVGGMGRLTTQNKKRKILRWFEQTFDSVSGEDQLLQLDEFTRALHINGFVDRFYQLMDVSGGRLTLPELLDAFGKIACMDRDAKWLAWFEQQFSNLAGNDRQIDLEEFKEALHVKESFFAERFFHLFDKDSSGSISLRELMDGLTLLTNGSEVDKLHFLFQVYDVDGNGYIDFDELRTVLKSCMGESTLKFSDDKLDELTRALIEDADADNSGTITFEELQAELDKYPGVIENLTISAANWLKPPRFACRRRLNDLIPHWLTWRYVRNNLTWVIWVVGYFLINLFLFVEAAIRHRQSGPAVAIARGCGQCLNFNPTFVIILMFRRVLTWVRSTRISFLFPLDQSIELHKLVGWTIFFFSCLHTLPHIANFTLLSLKPDGLPMWQYFFYIKTGLGWVYGTAGLTGCCLLTILTIMVLCSLPCVRRKGYFEVFFWTHNLFIPWYILLILHGTHFWKWFLVPALVYIIERIIRSKWIKLARYGRIYIKEASLLPSKVTHLVLSRPLKLNYQPGDYIFLRVPAIAKYEWHPFTISSTPEQQGFLWLHIRSVGTWTNKLYKFFEERNRLHEKETIKMQLPRERQSTHMIELEQMAVQEVDGESCDLESLNDVHPLAVDEEVINEEVNVAMIRGQDFSHMIGYPAVINVQVDKEEDKGIEVFIDGPYGTPSTHIFQAEHAVLIGAGIGVTPFASILQSIMMRYHNARQVCPRCNHGWTGEIPSSVMRLKKVDFFWINRDQRSFEWFVSLLNQLEMEQSEQGGFDRFLDMHMYMTSALRKTDVKAIGLQMALDLIHKKQKRDLITGLKTKTQAGRPDWEKVFRKLDNERRGRVSVFFCGPPAISKILKSKCAQYRFEFRKEHF